MKSAAPAEVVGHLGSGTVVAAHGKPMVCHVQNEIFAHNGQANQADVTLGLASVASSFDRH